MLLKGLPALVARIGNGARELLDKPAEYATGQRRRDLVQGLIKLSGGWHGAMSHGLRHVLQHGITASQPGDLPPPGAGSGLSLVENDVIEREILTSRLALAIMDRAGWEFTDLRSRMAMLERRGELDTHDMLRAHILARVVLDAWRSAGLSAVDWREAQPLLHDEFAGLAQEAYHETNRWLVEHRVMADVDLRPYIRRTVDSHAGLAGTTTQAPLRGPAPARAPGARGVDGRAGRDDGHASGFGASASPGLAPSASHAPAAYPGAGGGYGAAGSHTVTGQAGAGRGLAGRPLVHARGGMPAHPAAAPASATVGEETRMMTRAGPLARGSDHAEAVLGRLNRLVGRHLPGFADTAHARPVTEALSLAINNAQQNLRRRLTPPQAGATIAHGQAHAATVMTGPMLLEELQQRKQALKQAASTPEERATIEIVALMFQSILTEDRIPAACGCGSPGCRCRCCGWPSASPISSPPRPPGAPADRPHGRLRDGLRQLGRRNVGDALEKEIKRVVQVVEAYPDTGRRVFQTVLTEFEKFLEHYFKNENEASRKRRVAGPAGRAARDAGHPVHHRAAPHAQRGAGAGGRAPVPVPGLGRRAGHQRGALRRPERRDQADEARRRRPDLVGQRQGHPRRACRSHPPPAAAAEAPARGHGLGRHGPAKQDEHMNALNNSLAGGLHRQGRGDPERPPAGADGAAGDAGRTAARREDVEIDESMVLDLSGHESSGAGGGAPKAARCPRRPMVAWARELQVGSWYMLEYRGRTNRAAGLARHAQAAVAVRHPQGRCVLFQQQRLASFLQAGLLLPAQDEALTVKATRSALAKLDADPSRLLN
jgi:hypothetical protein